MTRSPSTPRLRLTLLWYLLVIVLVAISERPWSAHWSGQWAALAGLLLVAVAALGRIWCSVFIAGHKDEELVTIGPYSLCRNPLYGLSMLAGVGIGLASRSVILLAVTIALLALLHVRAVRDEEQVLFARHGEAFQRYCAQVPRFLPRHWRATTTVTSVNVVILWKAFLDAASFLVLYAAIVGADLLQRAMHWPVALTLW
jgi:protein-S-isoprenylcysteine O-methyltransferase Ste14